MAFNTRSTAAVHGYPGPVGQFSDNTRQVVEEEEERVPPWLLEGMCSWSLHVERQSTTGREQQQEDEEEAVAAMSSLSLSRAFAEASGQALDATSSWTLLPRILPGRVSLLAPLPGKATSRHQEEGPGSRGLPPCECDQEPWGGGKGCPPSPCVETPPAPAAALRPFCGAARKAALTFSLESWLKSLAALRSIGGP